MFVVFVCLPWPLTTFWIFCFLTTGSLSTPRLTLSLSLTSFLRLCRLSFGMDPRGALFLAALWLALRVLQQGDTVVRLDLYRLGDPCTGPSCNQIDSEKSPLSHFSNTLVLPRALPAALAHYVLVILCAFLIPDAWDLLLIFVRGGARLLRGALRLPRREREWKDTLPRTLHSGPSSSRIRSTLSRPAICALSPS